MNEAKKDIAETPLMKQHNAIKAKYPDAILLFRVGDFYETFGSDAIKTSEILGIVLTKRANGSASYIELAGFPYHALDTYLPKLVKAGMRVAICDQLEDPKLAKKIVKRGITEIVTPGVVYNDKVLENKQNNFLAGIHLGHPISGISFLDISTGEFYLAQGNNDYIDNLLQTFKPNEVIVQKNKLSAFRENFGDKFYTTTFDDWVFTNDFATNLLLNQFQTTSLKGYGVEELQSGIIAAGAALHYLGETQHDKISHICKVSRIVEDHYVWLDKFTMRNLELIHASNEKALSLTDVIDHTQTPMGSRMLKRWLVMPLKNKAMIEERLEAVDFFMQQPSLTEEIRKHIKHIGDLERLISKVAIGKINPRETLHINKALHAVESLKMIFESLDNASLNKIAEQLNPCKNIRQRIETQLVPEPPVILNKGGIIARGVSDELDQLHQIAFSGKDYLLQIQQREVENTGIPSLKIAFNNVFGYYIEVTNTHKNKVPESWTRKQTLANCERYITEELKEYEEKILGAEEKIYNLEIQLYNEIISDLYSYINPIQLNAILIATIDCLLSFEHIAHSNNYVKPEVNETLVIDIIKGRHPVIEQNLPPGEKYIANDVFLDNSSQQIIVITGPNMSGKSALLRQTALITLLAQIGSFVPAERASIGIVDKIFTRVGASDNISSGESTFMVEMNETASILNNISGRSLILLDEIGRGTSTYDGISIAWAIAEYLHENKLFHPKVLFATHYHELNEMAKLYGRIKNFHVTVKEIGNKVLFLRKLAPGGTEHSFGIHVAKMAGMPQRIIERANEILSQLEKEHSSTELNKKGKKSSEPASADKYQLSFIQLNDPLLDQIKDDILDTDIDTLTPIEALMKLNEIKKLLNK